MKSSDLYNIVNGLVAQTKVNVQDALHIGRSQSEKLAALLPGAFHSKIERKVKTMQEMKMVVIVNGKAIFDIETLFPRLLVFSQQRGVEVTDIFQYELSHVPASLIHEFDVVLVDASQLLYHVVWPVAWTAGDLASSFGVKISRYTPETQ